MSTLLDIADERAQHLNALEELQQPALCACGCGRPTSLIAENDASKGLVRGERRQWASAGCSVRGKRHPRWNEGKSDKGTYVLIHMPDHPHALSNGYVLEHVLVASRALGKPLPKGAAVHHVNGDGHDNRPENLVVCPDNAYHRTLHRRMEALAASGHADWRKCGLCKHYDAPENLYIDPSGKNVKHRACAAQDFRKRKELANGYSA